MKRMVAIYPAWLEIARISMRSISAYRFDYFTYGVWLLIRLFILREIWLAVYDGEESLNGISAETQIVFITITALQGLVLAVHLDWLIQEQVTSGKVALDLIRPLGFMPQLLAQQIGRTVGYLPFLIPIVPLAILIGSLQMPDPDNLPPYVLSLVLAYVVNILIWMLVGMLAFWIMNVNALRIVLGLLSDFLGGVLVPLWFMPDALRVALEFLPFQAGLFLPAAIYTGEVTGTGLIRPFVVQLVWIGMLWLLAIMVWRRAQRRIVIQGG